jgi:hypothetical protein
VHTLVRRLIEDLFVLATGLTNPNKDVNRRSNDPLQVAGQTLSFFQALIPIDIPLIKPTSPGPISLYPLLKSICQLRGQSKRLVVERKIGLIRRVSRPVRLAR